MTLCKPEPALSRKAQDEAQNLIAGAWEARTHEQMIELAREALSLNPLAPDAHVILALDREPGSDEQLELYRLAYHLADTAIQHFRQAAANIQIWHATPGAKEWLRRNRKI
jgi:hypothetical protein